MARYLITSTRTEAQITLGYDQHGLLCEVQVSNIDVPEHRLWPFHHAPLQEAEVRRVFSQGHLRFTVLQVTFDEFWRRYAYKEGKKDAQKAWERMNEQSRQLAYDHIERYRAACMRDRKHLMYPATYLRAERWLDHT